MKNNIKNISIYLIILLSIIVIGMPAFASAPPLRTQMSLNGKWDFAYGSSNKIIIAVPGAWDQDSRVGRDLHEADYIKTLTVPCIVAD